MKLLGENILIATQNHGKIKEIKEIIKDYPIKIISLLELDPIIEPEETGKTFLENAQLKAKYYSQKTGLISLADDSGLSIEQMNGEPGVYSARWMGTGKSYQHAFSKIYKILKDKNLSSSKAHFTCAISLYIPNSNEFIDFSAEVHGNLTFPARGENGFGYDPIFIPNGHDKTFAQMSSEEKNKISHRSQALQSLKLFLSGEYNE